MWLWYRVYSMSAAAAEACLVEVETRDEFNADYARLAGTSR